MKDVKGAAAIFDRPRSELPGIVSNLKVVQRVFNAWMTSSQHNSVQC